MMKIGFVNNIYTVPSIAIKMCAYFEKTKYVFPVLLKFVVFFFFLIRIGFGVFKAGSMN